MQPYRRTRRDAREHRKPKVAVSTPVCRALASHCCYARNGSRRGARQRPQRNARGERRDQGPARLSLHASAIVALHDALLLGERAATRGRSATGVCGDDDEAERGPPPSVASALAHHDAPQRGGRIATGCSPWRRPTFHTGTPVANDATRDAQARRRPRHPGRLHAFPFPQGGRHHRQGRCAAYRRTRRNARARRDGRWRCTPV